MRNQGHATRTSPAPLTVRAPSAVHAPGPARDPATPPPLRPRPDPSPPAGRYASIALAPRAAAAAEARAITRDHLRRWDMQAITENAELVASELVANASAVVPPGTPGLTLIFTIHARPPEVHISTWDIGPGHPDHTTPDDEAETGRGLAIIDTLTSSNWGWWPTPRSGGKVVYATLTTQPADRHQQPGTP